MKKVSLLCSILLFKVLCPGTSYAQGDRTLPQSVLPEQVSAKGELLLRLDRNFDRMETDYPEQGRTVVRIGGDSGRKVRLFLPVPSWTEGASLRINGKRRRAPVKDGFMQAGPLSAGDVVEYSFKVKDWYDGPQTPSNNPDGVFRVLHGPLLLCSDEDVTFARGSRLEQLGGNVFRVRRTDVFLHPLRHLMDPGFRVELADDCARKILF